MTDYQLATGFFLQLACLVAACRIVGIVAAKFRQPQVVAEMITGVLLGPSLFGLLAPTTHAMLFPKASLTVVYVVAQMGLVLYMFLVGVEFNHELVSGRFKSAATISAAGIVVPFAMGGVLSLYLRSDGRFFSGTLGPLEGALYIGAAMSITAFPMLARIIYERGISGTTLGTMALAAGASDDAAAWTLLALVLASFKADVTIAVWAIAGGIAYAVVVLGFGRPWLAKLGEQVEQHGAMTGKVLGLVLGLLSVGAWFTDRVGIYSVFGAFILGAAMPRGLFAKELQRLIEPITTNFLLPLFFVYSGLNTRINLVNTPELIAIAVVVVLIASVGKGVACTLAAKATGMTWNDSLAVGSLMNARGLMELIILNVGLERGLITPTLFTIMVVMAIVTTVVAGPIFELVYRRQDHMSQQIATVGAGS